MPQQIVVQQLPNQTVTDQSYKVIYIGPDGKVGKGPVTSFGGIILNSTLTQPTSSGVTFSFAVGELKTDLNLTSNNIAVEVLTVVGKSSSGFATFTYRANKGLGETLDEYLTDVNLSLLPDLNPAELTVVTDYSNSNIITVTVNNLPHSGITWAAYLNLFPVTYATN